MKRWFCWAVLIGLGTVSLQGDDDLEALPWDELDAYQRSIARDDFLDLLEEVYAPGKRWAEWVRVEEGGARVARSDREFEDAYFLEFGPPSDAAGEGDEARLERSLAGLRIAVDPGHLGGRWGPMERRAFSVEGGPVVQEGDLTLAAARRLKRLLEQRGVEVWLTRTSDEPATSLRPEDLMAEAAERLTERDDLDASELQEAQRRLAERLFLVTEEIKARAERLAAFQPDLAIALHINAAGWPDPLKPSLVAENNAHVIVHGCYLPAEIADEEMRLQMLLRLLKGHHRLELPLAGALAEAMVEATALEPYRYGKDNALQMDKDGYVWARNLLANRIFDCPVVYLEPWIANSEAVYRWAAAGDYEGYRLIDGEERRSLPAVYADFVLDGLLRYFDERDR